MYPQKNSGGVVHTCRCQYAHKLTIQVWKNVCHSRHAHKWGCTQAYRLRISFHESSCPPPARKRYDSPALICDEGVDYYRLRITCAPSCVEREQPRGTFHLNHNHRSPQGPGDTPWTSSDWRERSGCWTIRSCLSLHLPHLGKPSGTMGSLQDKRVGSCFVHA